MVEVRFENITKIFDTPSGEETAVDDLNFTIRDGEFFSLVGPSGCGKTTTLRMVAGLETPSSGDIYFDDSKVTDLSPQQRDISMVFQDITLFPHMTTYKNIGYGLRVQKDSGDRDEKIRNIAEMLDISELLDKNPTQLSGGQRQRVSLGRALVREPNIILFDEPLSDLDAKLKRELRVEIQRMHQKFETTMMYVTHDQEEAMTMSDRIALMRSGQVEQFSDPVTLFNSPQSEFVGKFIGEPTMNVLDARLSANGMLHVSEQNDVVPIDLSERLERMDLTRPNDGEVKLGFRPSHIRLKDADAQGFLNSSLEMVEPIGTEYIIYLRDDDGNEIIAVNDDIPSQNVGTRVKIEVPEKLYLFDPRNGDLLLEHGTEQKISTPENL